MLLLKNKTEERTEDSEMFSYASSYITDELELIQDQQENIVIVSEELEKAFSQTDKIKELIRLVKKIDKTVTEKEITEKRKQESGMINLMEDVKGLLKRRRYEDIEKLMLRMQQKSQFKIKLSQEELQNLRLIMDHLVELYQESAGLCRLYTAIYEQVRQLYNKCSQELNIEATEQTELSGAGIYTEKIH